MGARRLILDESPVRSDGALSEGRMDQWVERGDGVWEGEVDEVYKAAVGALSCQLVVVSCSRVLDDGDLQRGKAQC